MARSITAKIGFSVDARRAASGVRGLLAALILESNGGEGQGEGEGQVGRSAGQARQQSSRASQQIEKAEQTGNMNSGRAPAYTRLTYSPTQREHEPADSLP